MRFFLALLFSASLVLAGPRGTFDSQSVTATTAFAATSGATDKLNLCRFGFYIRQWGLWSTSVCWPMRSGQNAGSGTTVYSFGGLGTANGTMVNSPTWGTDGITTNGTSSYIEATIPDTRTGSVLHVCNGGSGNDSSTGDHAMIACNSSGRANGSLVRLGAMNAALYQASTVPTASILQASSASITSATFTALSCVRGSTSFLVSSGNGGAYVAATPPTAIVNSITKYVIGARDDFGATGWNGTHSLSLLSASEFTSPMLARIYWLNNTTLGRGLLLP